MNIMVKKTWLDECRDFMLTLEKGKEYSTEEINLAYRNSGGTRSNPIPSDYCYNITNKGIDFSDSSRRLFEWLGKGKYKYLGQNYPYTGDVTRTNRNGKTTKFGRWENGTFFPVKSTSSE